MMYGEKTKTLLKDSNKKQKYWKTTCAYVLDHLILWKCPQYVIYRLNWITTKISIFLLFYKNTRKNPKIYKECQEIQTAWTVL